MNREQQRYFVKRVEEIKAEKISKIKAIAQNKRDAVPRVAERVIEQLNKHKKDACKEIFDAIMRALKSRDRVFSIQLCCESVPCGDTALNIALPFAASANEQYKNAMKTIDYETEKRIDKVDEDAKKLIDLAMFCQLPDEFADMLAQFEQFE